jgi:hypothetical protein
VLRDHSPSSLIAAIEGNLFELCRQYALWPRAAVHDGPDLLWSITDVPFPVFNSIMRARLRPVEEDGAIAGVVARGKARKVPVLWWTGPATLPSDLASRLIAHGFRGDTIPGMAAGLQELPESLPAPSGLRIMRVREAKTMATWCRTLASGFAIPDFARDAFFEFSCALGFADEAPYRNYLGLRDGARYLRADPRRAATTLGNCCARIRRCPGGSARVGPRSNCAPVRPVPSPAACFILAHRKANGGRS